MIECDIKTCVGCRMCEVACSSHHFQAVSPALARIRVGKLEEIGLDMAVACLSCAEKPCLVCPADALSVGATGEIVVDLDECNGCAACVEACPVGAVGFVDDRPLFCDLCGGSPACVAVCPSGSLFFHEEFRETSMQEFLNSKGTPGEKRARYVRLQGAPVRALWRSGARVDS